MENACGANDGEIRDHATSVTAFRLPSERGGGERASLGDVQPSRGRSRPQFDRFLLRGRPRRVGERTEVSLTACSVSVVSAW